jgi:hypothetical protein
MAHYGLTTKTPEKLFLISLPDSTWRESAREFMQAKIGGGPENLAAYRAQGLPFPRRLQGRVSFLFPFVRLTFS